MRILLLLAAAALAVARAHGAEDSQATNALGAIKQIVFTRHGEHAAVGGGPSPCLSEVGVARGLMLMRYFTEKGAAPPGVLSPTYVYAMDGDTKEATPKSVRPINTAIPYVIAKKLAPSHFNHNFTQKEPAVVARDMLDNRGGEVLLIVWLHWDAVGMLNYLGVPVTGWNDDDLDTNTTDTYKPMIVVTPTRAGVDAVLYHTPPISNETLLADFDRSIVDKVYWKRRVPWADVVKQQGSVERVVPVREA